MKRSRRITLIAVTVVVAAMVPTLGNAKPTPGPTYWVGPGEIPYLSHGVGVTSTEPGYHRGTSSDDRSFSRAESLENNRSFSRATTLESAQVVSDDGRSIELNAYRVTGFALALILAMASGMGIAAWRGRKKLLTA